MRSHMAGTAKTTEARRRLASSMSRSGSNRERQWSDEPLSTAAWRALSPCWWYIGSAWTRTSLRRQRQAVMALRMDAWMSPWRNGVSLGAPVVPEVNAQTATSVERGRCVCPRVPPPL